MMGAAAYPPTALLFRGGTGNTGRVIPPVDHDRPQEGDDRLAFLVVALSLHLHDTHVGPRTGVARLQYFAPGVDRVAFEDGSGETHLIPPQVGKDVLRDV